MRVLRAVAIASIGCFGGSALADGVAVRLLNDTPNNLIVTLRDLNAQPPQDVVSSEVLNGNASLSFTVTADATGLGHLAWTATTVDRDMRRCGRREVRRVKDGATVRVHANHHCPGS